LFKWWRYKLKTLKKQEKIVDSTTKAGYIAAFDAAKVVKVYKSLIKSMD
jgi:hypothetical protein